MSENVFTMAGDTGDAIYAMPTIKNLGGGHLVFWPRSYVREPMSEEKVKRIATFFASQPYIFSVQFKTHEPNATHNLDDFRATWMNLQRTGQHRNYNLAELFLLTFNLPLSLANEKWLDIDPNQSSDVVFNRTQRYQNDRFPWQAVCNKYVYVGRRAVFLGTEEEYENLKRLIWFFGVDWKPTNRLWDAALIIAGAKLFVGNQSALYAIAEGLKMPRVLEVWRQYPNCCFPGAVLGWDENVVLPYI